MLCRRRKGSGRSPIILDGLRGFWAEDSLVVNRRRTARTFDIVREAAAMQVHLSSEKLKLTAEEAARDVPSRKASCKAETWWLLVKVKNKLIGHDVRPKRGSRQIAKDAVSRARRAVASIWTSQTRTGQWGGL